MTKIQTIAPKIRHTVLPIGRSEGVQTRQSGRSRSIGAACAMQQKRSGRGCRAAINPSAGERCRSEVLSLTLLFGARALGDTVTLPGAPVRCELRNAWRLTR